MLAVMGLTKNGIGLICLSFFLFSILIHNSAAATGAFLSAPDNSCAPLLTDTSPDNLKLFDAHVHMTSDYTSAFVISEMDQARVGMALLYPDGKSDDQTSLDYMSQYPGRFSSFVAYKHTDDPHFIDYVKTQLNTGKFTGIGEINLRYYSGSSYTPPPTAYIVPDSPLILQLVDLSAAYDVPISFHFVPDDPDANAAFERMLNRNKNATFLWCHLGFNNMPLNADTLNGYLLRYPNLFFDTAGIQNMMSEPGELGSNWRGVLVNQSDGHLNAQWKQLFETWNARILWGSDAGGGNDPNRWFNYANNTVQNFPPDATGRWRGALANLDPNSARNIFNANARAVILKEARPAYNYSVASDGQCFPISIRSGSSVSALAFDRAASTITFKTADSSGTANSAVVFVPAGLLNGTFTVQVNGKSVQFGDAPHDTYTSINIGYGGGINTIAITATPPVNQTSQNQPPTHQPAAIAKDDAQSALSAAQTAISDANTAGKDTSAANKKLADATAATDAGNYSQAKELADEAKTSALGAPNIVAAKQTTAANQTAAIAPVNSNPQTKGLDLTPIAGAIAVIIVIAAVYLGMRKPVKRK